MKRNESILVYSVTGLLVVILAVAILFGNEQGAQAHSTARGKPLDELAGVNAASDETTPLLAGGDATRDSESANPKGDLAPAPSVPPADSEAAPAAGGAVPQPVLAAADGGSTVPASAPLSAPAPSAATQAMVLLGESKRDGSYRIVTVRRDDTFSALVQRWCGGLDQLEVAESLNEELNLRRLDPGTTVCLPWVDDEKLVAAHLARKQKQESETKVVSEARDKGLTYTIKSGDKLWNIAVARVGAKNASKFIEEVKALNAELLADPNKLTAGKTLILPR